MLIGYVSDERYVALPDVLLELETYGRLDRSPLAGQRSGVRRRRPGPYRVTLAKSRLRLETRRR